MSESMGNASINCHATRASKFITQMASTAEPNCKVTGKRSWQKSLLASAAGVVGLFGESKCEALQTTHEHVTCLLNTNCNTTHPRPRRWHQTENKRPSHHSSAISPCSNVFEPETSDCICLSSAGNIKKLRTGSYNHNTHLLVTTKELTAYLYLLEEPVIKRFLEADRCLKVSDKFLVAMVLAYFKRGQFKLREYTRTNFFVGLYLANDMEEDEEELKYEIFPWLLGDRWRKTYPRFLQKRDQLLRRIDYRALVSRRCCEEVMKLCPDHYVWQRERESHHGGAIRKYAADSEEYYPRGPSHSPRFCQDCDIRMAEMVLDDDSSADNKVDTFYWIRTEE